MPVTDTVGRRSRTTAAGAVRSSRAAPSPAAFSPGGWISTSSERSCRRRAPQRLAGAPSAPRAARGGTRRLARRARRARTPYRPAPGRPRRGGRGRSGGARPPTTRSARCISRSRAREARVSRRVSTPISGTPSSSRASSAPARDPPERRQHLGGPLLDGLDGVVGLEQQRLALRRLDPGVDLEQPVLLGLELVLAAPQVGQPALGVAAVEHARAARRRARTSCRSAGSRRCRRSCRRRARS